MKVYRDIYEALDQDGRPCYLFDAISAANAHAQMRQAALEDRTVYKARFYRRVEAETEAELRDKMAAIADEWDRDDSPGGVVSTQQVAEASTPQNQPEMPHGRDNNDTSVPQPEASDAVADSYAAPGPGRGTGATGRRERPPYISIHPSKAKERPRAVLIDEKMADYYRYQAGFAADLALIMRKAALGPTAIARLVNVDRSTVARWTTARALPTDPVIFLAVVMVAMRLRGKAGWL